MVARTYGQSATLTSFGATVASWGHPLIDPWMNGKLRASTLWVTCGRSGYGSVLGDDPMALRAELAAIGITGSKTQLVQ